MCKFKENCPCYDEDYCRNKKTCDEKCFATLIMKCKPLEQHTKEIAAMQDVINARDERITELQGQVDELIKENDRLKNRMVEDINEWGEAESELEHYKNLVKAIKKMCKLGG